MRTTDKEEALQTYREKHAVWREWLAKQLPYEIDLNLYIDEETTPEIHNGLHTDGGHRSYGS